MGQHERRKFLSRRGDAGVSLFRFAGFDRYGGMVCARAEALARAGYGPAVLGHRDGFLELEFREGRPLGNGTGVDASLGRIAEYVAFRKRTFAAERSQDVDALVEMVRINAREALDDRYAAGIQAFERLAIAMEPRCTVPDARMMRDEWLVTDSGLLKTDGYDHGDDDFYPGPSDSAWDLAGAAVELGLNTRQRERLLAAYARAAQDPVDRARFAFNEIAYLAFRVGYAEICASQLGETMDGRRFAALRDRYTRGLGVALSCLGANGAASSCTG
jgi:hypothetical protein